MKRELDKTKKPECGKPELTPEEKCEAIVGLSCRIVNLQEKDLVDGQRTDEVKRDLKTAQSAIQKLCFGKEVVEAFMKKDVMSLLEDANKEAIEALKKVIQELKQKVRNYII